MEWGSDMREGLGTGSRDLGGSAQDLEKRSRVSNCYHFATIYFLIAYSVQVIKNWSLGGPGN